MARIQLAAGDVIGEKYVVDRRLGEARAGTIYLARHSLTDREVALQWIRIDDDMRRERVLQDARSLERLSHPNVVQVLDGGEQDGAVFLVMEPLQGETLRAHVGGKRLEPAQAIDLLLPACSGVAAAHAAGVPCDLDPDNLFVCLDHAGSALDTKVLAFAAKEPREGVAAASSAQSTQVGSLDVTSAYMAPERLDPGSELDARADVYALGVILYELLTGRLPYDTSDARTMAVAILNGALRPLELLRDDLPDGLYEAVATALATDRAERHADVAAFAHAIEPYGTRRVEAPSDLRAGSSGEPAGDDTAPAFAQAQRSEDATKQAIADRLDGDARGTGPDAEAVMRARAPRAAPRSSGLWGFAVAVLAGVVIALAWSLATPPPDAAAPDDAAEDATPVASEALSPQTGAAPLPTDPHLEEPQAPAPEALQETSEPPKPRARRARRAKRAPPTPTWTPIPEPGTASSAPPPEPLEVRTQGGERR